MPRARKPVIDRLLAKVRVDSNGCWIYTGALSSSGYGSIGLGGRGEGSGSTHVVTYTHFVGPVDAGMDLDHLCRVRACCNPEHLEPVTRTVNLVRGSRHSPTHCGNGHLRTQENTMLKSNGKRECRDCYRARAAARRQAVI